MSLMKRTPTQHPHWDAGRSATFYDLRQLAFAVLLFELVIAALTIATRACFGVRTAVWVGFGIGVLVSPVERHAPDEIPKMPQNQP